VGTNVSLTGSNGVGGIVGFFAGGTISDCVNAASVKGVGEVGGIIGTSSFRVPSVQGQITSCRNSGRIESTDYFCGGIGGKFAGQASNFTVTGCANTGEVIGYKTVGGIVGYCSKTLVSNCMNQGRITAPAQISSYEQKIGGVIGRRDNGGTISNNYYTGDYFYYEDELGNEQTVSFKAAKDGTYTLRVNVGNMDLDYLHLIDNMTGADVDLLVHSAPELVEGPTQYDGVSTGSTTCYTFTAKTTDYASRFRLVFNADDASTGSASDAPFAFVNIGNIVIIADAGDATLQVIDMMGRVIRTVGLSQCGSRTIAGMTSGVYVLRLIDGDAIKTQKMVIE
jgi:hypothetical protein